MITVLYGPIGRVVAEAARRLAAPAWLTGAPAPHAWQGVRELVAWSADRAGFDATIARHRAVLALIYPELGGVADAATQDLRADLRSCYTHSWASWQPLITAAAALIRDLAADTAIAVPELAHLDLPSRFAVLEAARGAPRLALCVGHDPARVDPPPALWGVPGDGGLDQVRSQLCDYQCAAACEVVWLGAGATAAPPAVPTIGGWSAPAPDARALATPAAPSTHQLLVCVAAMQWAFEAYAFKQAWQIGLLVEPHADRLPDDARASHAAITALAATNAYFVDRPTPGFDAPLYAMYARAVGLAREPVRAASLAIRFAFAAVDRHAADAAARLADADAAAAALAADDPYTRYLRAWLTIGHALHAFHRDELAAADERARAACTALEAVEASAALAPPQLRDDARCARFMISAHSVVHFATADAARAAAWFVRAEALRPTVPVLLSFEVFHWALLPAPVDDHGVIYDRCVAGLRDAEAAWDSKLWFLYHALAAGCAYRLGRLGDAAGHVHALLGRDWYGNTGALITGDIRPLALRILWRAGWLDAAIAAAERWLAADGTARVELRGLLALALASRGDVAAAQAALDVAIDDAVEHGDQAEMTAIAIRGVEVALAANERAAAEAALASAWELAEDAPGTFAAAIADADRLRLCMVTCEVAGATVALIDRACATLPASLGAPDAWWDARRLRELLAAMPADAARDAALDRVAALDHIAGLDPIAGLIAPA